MLCICDIWLLLQECICMRRMQGKANEAYSALFVWLYNLLRSNARSVLSPS